MTNLEIATYIAKNYPDSIFSSNFYRYEEYDVEHLDNFLSHEQLGLCSCGDPEICKASIRDLLYTLLETTPSIRSERLMFYFDVDNIYNDPLLLFMVYMLNDKGFLEHGSSVGSSYPTELGRMYLHVLEQMEDI